MFTPPLLPPVSSPSSASASSSTTLTSDCTPSNSRPPCYHHIYDTHTPGRHSASRKYIQYRTSRDILGDGVLEEEDVCIHLLQARHRYCLLKQQILPTTLYIMFRIHPHQPTGRPMMDPPQLLSDMGGHQPYIRPEKKYYLHDRFVEHPGGPGV